MTELSLPVNLQENDDETVTRFAVPQRKAYSL